MLSGWMLGCVLSVFVNVFSVVNRCLCLLLIKLFNLSLSGCLYSTGIFLCSDLR